MSNKYAHPLAAPIVINSPTNLASRGSASFAKQSQTIFIAVPYDLFDSEHKHRTTVRYQHLVEHSPDAIFLCQHQKLVLFNRAGMDLLGAKKESQLRGKSLLHFVQGDPQALPSERTPVHTNVPARGSFIEQIWCRLDGSHMHVEIGLTTLMHNNAPATQLVVRDITERKRAEALQLEQNRILNMIATGSKLPDIFEALIRFAESLSPRSVCSILQLNNEGSRFIEGAAPSLPPSIFSSLRAEEVGPSNGTSGTAAYRGEPVMSTNIETDPLWGEQHVQMLEHGLKACTSWPIFGKHKKVLGTFSLYFREASPPGTEELEVFNICTKLAGIAIESRVSEQRIRYLAHYDSLTSLPNRFLFREYLDLALRNAQRHKTKFAVLFLDLDRFKQINDTLGHDAGDLVLQEIAQRLRKCLRDTDKIARMGGDEFYVLIEELKDGRYAAEVAQKLLTEVCRPIHIGETQCDLGVSIGISVYPEDGANAQALLKNADGAMYRAKDAGKNTYRFHSLNKIPNRAQAAVTCHPLQTRQFAI